MYERSVEFQVGVLVVASLIITAILVAMFGEFPSPFTPEQNFVVWFSEAPGVAESTPVRKSGVRIGRVTKVALVNGDKFVSIGVKIEGDYKIYQNEAFQISRTVWGDAVVEVVRSADPTASDAILLTGGKPLRGLVKRDALDMVQSMEGDLLKAFKAVEEAGTSITKTSEGINKLLDNNGDSVGEVVPEMKKALASMNEFFERTNGLIGKDEDQQKLKVAVEKVPEILERSYQILGRMDGTIDKVDENLNNMTKFTDSLGNRGGEAIDRMYTAIDKLDRVMANVEDFTDNLDSETGSLGRLVNSPELYDELSEAAKNVNRLSRQVRPIMDDLRVFSDKIARHPGVIVRDAAKPGLGIK